MRKDNLIIILLLFLSGCAAQGPFFKPGENAKNVYLKEHPELTDKIREAIISGQVVLGMSIDDVVMAWGKPDKVFPKGVPRSQYEPPPWNEEWYWKGDLFRTLSQDCTVTFVNDKVSNVQWDSVWK